ncbi:hypothetical protein [Burkholderia cepacia]|nr:hypothetical protein [Burkholderia cepacia]
MKQKLIAAALMLASLTAYGTCQEFRVLRSVKRSQLMAAVNRSPNRMAN